MKFLGIDYGTKRMGLAISDDNGRLAFPKDIIKNDKNVLKKVEDLIKKEEIEQIVIGDSVNFSGIPNKISSKIDLFIKEIEKKFKLKVYKQKEFLTSVEARWKKGKEINNAKKVKDKKNNSKIDDSAAALILQRYLDRKNKKT